MPSEVEKLRALLAEAQEVMRDFAENWDCDTDAHKYGTTCRVCDAEKMKQRIDAALAEPVGDSALADALRFNEKLAVECETLRQEIVQLRGALASISLTEYESTSSASEKVRDHARIARKALYGEKTEDKP